MTSNNAASDSRVVVTLSLLYVFRMLGLFMVFPVLAIFGVQYSQATPFLLGLALGAYGLTQAVFQIPLGLLSDVVGRKPVIFAGLLLFVLGSVVAAMADSVWGLIVGRLIQGAGAIASAVMALLADLTSEQNRTKAMAVIGVSIGLSFSLALVAGPAIAGAFGISSIFWVSALLACVGIAILVLLVPTPRRSHTGVEHKAVLGLLQGVLASGDLRRLDVGIFALHLTLTATFVVVPLSLEGAGVEAVNHWPYYLSIMVAAFAAMLPFIYIAERKQKLKRVFLAAVALIVAAEVWLWTAQVLWQWLFGLFVFFTAFNLLEATLPSLVSKQSPAGSKGTAMGVYSTSQFLGASLGGVLGGAVYVHSGASSVFIMCAAVCAIWWLYALGMRPPLYLNTVVVDCPQRVAQNQILANVAGVVEASWVEADAALYLKVSKHEFSEAELRDYLQQM